MKNKKIWERYLDKVNELEELESVYRKLRIAFQEEGWTDKDLRFPPYYPRDIMMLSQKFESTQLNLINNLKLYFGDINLNELNDYIQKKLHIIDLETPLKNGSNKRDNTRDEDN